MKLIISTLGLICATVATCLPAQDRVAAIRQAALSDDTAWSVVAGLTTEIGPRPAGSDAEARARAWAVTRLKALGFANVHVEPFDIAKGWVRGVEQAEVVSPFPQALRLTALGGSGATGPAGLTGEIVAFPTLDALRAADPAPGARQDRLSRQPDEAEPGRNELWCFHSISPQGAFDRGAKRRPRHRHPLDWHRPPSSRPCRPDRLGAGRDTHSGRRPDRPRCRAGRADPRPRKAARGAAGTDPAIRRPAALGQRHRRGARPRSLLADHRHRRPPRQLGFRHRRDRRRCRGRDHHRGGEADHDVGPAAADHSPRLVRFRGAWRPGRRGLSGGACERPACAGVRGGFRQRSGLALSRDDGAGGQAGGRSDRCRRPSAARHRLGRRRRAMPAATSSRWSRGRRRASRSRQDVTRYFDIHHTADDTLDKIDPAQLRQAAAAWAVVLAIAADSPAQFGPVTPSTPAAH